LAPRLTPADGDELEDEVFSAAPPTPTLAVVVVVVAAAALPPADPRWPPMKSEKGEEAR